MKHFSQRDDLPGREIRFVEIPDVPKIREWSMTRDDRLRYLLAGYMHPNDTRDPLTALNFDELDLDDYFSMLASLPDDAVIHGQCGHTAGSYIAASGDASRWGL